MQTSDWVTELNSLNNEHPQLDWNNIETPIKFLQQIWNENDETKALTTFRLFNDVAVPVILLSENSQFVTKMFDALNRYRLEVLIGKVPLWCRGNPTPINSIPQSGVNLLQIITEAQTLIVVTWGLKLPHLFNYAGDMLGLTQFDDISLTTMSLASLLELELTFPTLLKGAISYLEKLTRAIGVETPALTLYSVVLSNALIQEQNPTGVEYPNYSPMPYFKQKITQTSFVSQSDNNPSQVKLFTAPLLQNPIPQFFVNLPKQVNETSPFLKQYISVILDNQQNAKYWDILHLSTLYPVIMRCSALSPETIYFPIFNYLTNSYDPSMQLSLLHVISTFQDQRKYDKVRYDIVMRLLDTVGRVLLKEGSRLCALSLLINLAKSDNMIGGILSPFAKQFFVPNILDTNSIFLTKVYGLLKCTNFTPNNIVSFLPYIFKNVTVVPGHYLYCGMLIYLLQQNQSGFFDIVLDRITFIVNSKMFFSFNSLPLYTCVFKIFKALLLSINKENANCVNKIINLLVVLKENSKNALLKDWALFFLRCIHHMSVQKMQKLLTHGNYPLVGTDSKLSLKTKDFLEIVNSKSMDQVGKDGMVVINTLKLQKLLSEDIESSTEKDSFIHSLLNCEEVIRIDMKEINAMTDGVAGRGGVIRLDIKRLRSVINKDEEEVERKSKEERGEGVVVLKRIPTNKMSIIRVNGTVSSDVETFIDSLSKAEFFLTIPLQLEVQNSHDVNDEFYVVPFSFSVQNNFKTVKTNCIKYVHPLLKRSGDLATNKIELELPLNSPHPCDFSVDPYVIVTDSQAQLCRLSIVTNNLSLTFDDFIMVPPHIDELKSKDTANQLYELLWNKLAYKANVPLDVNFETITASIAKASLVEGVVKKDDKEIRMLFVLAPYSFLLFKITPTQIKSISLVEVVTDYLDALDYVNSEFCMKHFSLD
ncbi:hypothetical protein EIN_249200 [Entamoeba invadens IP1]|uniref:Uncharacterized protein n=1 Tax=Entamoeba invadens IP1 TaxID=370355 RepID=A0A0A1UE56_ENTIV|nr:hypothetical protein EIN_249200 [Entamoeba invadens IP1]ELP94886.1 hypothetical protein EIN_249200 [Entamoeba invadens IP1]|eukprot:XP_004261657.1 hypothetical protein EIN_249200 [Entamoeba invadens IP1]